MVLPVLKNRRTKRFFILGIAAEAKLKINRKFFSKNNPTVRSIQLNHRYCNSNTNNTSIIRRNRNYGLYAVGKEFTEIKWMEIAEIYEKVMRENDGKCTTRKLAVEARIDKTSAHKAILF